MGGAALDPGTEGLAALTWRGTALEPGAEARRVSSVPPARILRTDRWASHTLCLRRLPTWTEEDSRHTCCHGERPNRGHSVPRAALHSG